MSLFSTPWIHLFPSYGLTITHKSDYTHILLRCIPLMTPLEKKLTRELFICTLVKGHNARKDMIFKGIHPGKLWYPSKSWNAINMTYSFFFFFAVQAELSRIHSNHPPSSPSAYKALNHIPVSWFLVSLFFMRDQRSRGIFRYCFFIFPDLCFHMVSSGWWAHFRSDQQLSFTNR
jgi:hypothetical protein